MGIVSWIVGSVEGYLASAGETAFGALLGSVGMIGMAMATLAVVFVALNAMLQVKSIDLRTAVMLGVKLALVGIFARNWAEFNYVTNAIVGGSEHLAGVIVGAAGGAGDGSASNFAEQFDRIIANLIDTANNIGSAMNWVGGAFFTTIAFIILAAMGAAAGLMIVFAKLMITFYVSIAPIMITMSLLNATKDYFQNWLTGIISYAFYGAFLRNKSYKRYMSINSKRADFVLLDADLNVALVVEYQGKGHFGNSRDSRARAEKSDTVKRQALREAGIGLVEVPAKFDRDMVAEIVRGLVSQNSAGS